MGDETIYLLQVFRYNSDVDHSNGVLIMDGVFECHTMEDEFRTQKVYGETRIPDRMYPIELRTEGGFHERYKQKFPDFHEGMLWIKDIPNFEYVLIHIGNDDDDTAGCLLVGSSVEKGKNFMGGSTTAYKAIYKKVLAAMKAGKQVFIDFQTLDDVTK